MKERKDASRAFLLLLTGDGYMLCYNFCMPDIRILLRLDGHLLILCIE